MYAKVFLAFLIGLMRNDPTTDAYLFHTCLIRIREAMRDKDAFHALARMSLIAAGFGGGPKIGESLDHYARNYAKNSSTSAPWYLFYPMDTILARRINWRVRWHS